MPHARRLAVLAALLAPAAGRADSYFGLNTSAASTNPATPVNIVGGLIWYAGISPTGSTTSFPQFGGPDIQMSIGSSVSGTQYFTGNGTAINANAVSFQAWNSSGPFVFNSNTTWVFHGANALLSTSLDATLQSTQLLSTPLTVQVAGGRTLTMSSGGFSGFGGNWPLTRTGGGTMVLNGGTTVDGLFLNGGTTQISSGTTLTTPFVQFGGGRLAPTTTVTLGGGVELRVAPGGGGVDAAVGTGTTLSGRLTGAGEWSVNGAGTVILGGTQSNTFAGTTTVSAGTLFLQKSAGATALGGTVLVAGGSVSLGAADQLADTADVSLSGGNFLLNGHTETVGGLTGTGGTVSFGPSGLSRLRVNPSADGTFAGTLSGGGLFTKGGAGTLTLSADNSAYTGKLSVVQGTLAVSADTSLGAAPGSATADALTLDGGAVRATATATLAANRGITLGPAGGGLDVSAGATLTTEAVAGSGGLTKTGGGTAVVPAGSSYTGATTVSGGTLRLGGLSAAGGAVTVASGSTLELGGSVARPLNAAGGSTVRVTAASVTVGGSGYNAVAVAGTLDIGTNSLSLTGGNAAQLGALTLLGDGSAGGTLTAFNGVAVPAGGVFAGRGTVTGGFATGAASLVDATGPLTFNPGFYANSAQLGGTLRTSSHAVAFTHNTQVRLGDQTILGVGNGPGTLTTAAGAYVDFGSTLVGHGTVNGRLTSNGFVRGIGPSGGDGLTFNGLVKGVGEFAGNVTFAGGYSPGLSPARVQVENVTLAGTNVQTMELGGIIQGSQYDAVVASGVLTFGGTLKLEFINGHGPAAGASYDLFDWAVATGTFAVLDLPDVGGAGLTWDTSALYTTGTLSLTPVPEPAAVVALAVVALGMIRARRR